MDLAPLLLPVVIPEEVDEILRNTKHGHELCDVIRTDKYVLAGCQTAAPTDDYPPFPEGEIFFEPYDGYRISRM